MHEDILYHSKNWGKEVYKRFEDESIGMIGVLGTQYMPDTPSAWWWTGCRVGSVLQSVNNILGANNTYINGDPVNSDVDAVVVDGLWFCIRKELFERIQFDEITFDSFHCYDHDICMQVISQGKRIIIAHNIKIEHASLGNVGNDFLVQLHAFYNKWKHVLPVTRGVQIDTIGQDRMKNIIKMLYDKNVELIYIRNSKRYQLAQFLSRLCHPFIQHK